MRIRAVCLGPTVARASAAGRSLFRPTPPRQHAIIAALHQVFLVVTLALVFGACSHDGRGDETIEELRIGVLPDEFREVLVGRLRPATAYLEEETGIPCRLILPESYESLLADFVGGRIDLAYMGAYTFVVARRDAGADPLVLRAEDRQFVSYYVVPGASTANSIEDLEHSRLAFGSRLSTSGHLMPRHFLTQQGIEPEVFFGEVIYTGSHDATAYAVRDGAADLGVVNGTILEAMFSDGRLDTDDVRILQETPPYVDYVWTARRALPDHIKDALVDAFLALGREREDHREVLRALGARAYYPAADSEFDAVASIVERLGLFEDER